MTNAKKRKALLLWRPSAAQFLALGFLLLIFTGALLLDLPISSRFGKSVGFLDALFTATSASCVTGQAVVNTAGQWSWFGRTVIILLIQVGGLGVMTLITMAMMALRRQITLRDRLTIQAAFNQEEFAGMGRLIVNVMKVTLIAEGLGALLLAIGFYHSPMMHLSLGQSIIYGVFHSISAFCNAGFDIIGLNSLAPFVGNPLINFTIMGLIVSGGLGYPCWVELARLLRTVFAGKLPFSGMWSRLSVHSKIVYSVTASLIFGGALLFLLIEWDNPLTLAPLSVPSKIWASLFQSVTLRTAGFTTVNQSGLNGSSQFISCLMMLAGGSPAGTAGGAKTVTIGVIVFSMLNALRGREKIIVFNRELSFQILQKALTVTTLMFILVVAGATLLRFTEHNNPFPHTFLDLLFECSSVCATVGLTTGITPHLSDMGKMLLIVLMFIGRLGPVTVVMALTEINRKSAAGGNASVAKANVLIG